MAADLKFCGLTRPEDAEVAAALGAAYAGVIFAEGPRLLTPERALQVLAAARGAGRVGVFGATGPGDIAAVAVGVGLDVVQLHGDPTAGSVDALRAHWSGEVWAVVRLEGVKFPSAAGALFREANAVVLDARVPGRLGGTGVTLPWADLRKDLDRLRGACRVVLAGGLTPENVGAAARALEPDVLDVSSGVEARPGIKDHARMRAFADAARPHGVER